MRQSGRASKPNSKYDTSEPPIGCLEHQPGTPINATLWCPRYLRRQGVQSKHWFRHLDFVKMDVDDIKKILWTDQVEKKYGEFTPLPPIGAAS